MRILVADDNPVNQLVAQGYLASLGYESDLADDGDVVLSKFADEPYDIVLMDLQMPKMDGCEATRNLRQRFGREPYVIAVSAHDESEIREIIAANDIDDYISKPISKDALVSAIERYSRREESG